MSNGVFFNMDIYDKNYNYSDSLLRYYVIIILQN